jgi:hypothetical protein
MALASIHAGEWGRAERLIAHARRIDPDDEPLRRLRLALFLRRGLSAMRWLLGRR